MRGWLARWFGRQDVRRVRTLPRLTLDVLEDRTVPALLGQQLFPSDNPWNQIVAAAPVAPNSQAIINNIIALQGDDGRLHPDFGQFYGGANDLYGIPFNVVHSSAMTLTSVVIDDYEDESDVQPAPIPANAVLEGDLQNGPRFGVDARGDSHLLIWDADTNIAYEYYRASRPSENSDGRWHADQETVWDMKTNTFRTRGYTSADAAGLSLLAGLVRPDEGLPESEGGQGVINHAIRFTLRNNIILDQYAYPASHTANPGNTNAAIQPPMGARFRLKDSFDLDSLNPQSRIIAQAMRDYGMILADNGSNFFFSGSTYSVDATNQRTLTWNDDDIQDTLHGLKSLRFSDFEVVDLTPVITGISSNEAAPGTQVTIVGQNFSGAAGHLQVWFGNTPAADVVYVDDGHVVATVPNGTGMVDIRVQSGESTPPDPDNVNHTIWGYGLSAVTPTARFVFGTGTGNAPPFIITPPTATPVLPGGTSTTLTVLAGDDGGERDLTYTWNVASKPIGAEDPTFSGNGTNSTKYVTVDIPTVGTYVFHVTVSDAQGLTVDSVDVIVPPAPAFSPGQNAVLTTDTPTFTWLPVANAASYRVRVQDRTTKRIVTYAVPNTQTSLTLTGPQALTPGHAYRWWLGVVQANRKITWRAPLYFRVAPLPAPILTGPATGVLTTDEPTFTWNASAGAARYTFWLRDLAAKRATVVPAGTATTLTLSFPLRPGHRYQWRVAAVSTNGRARFWSAMRTFSIAPLAAPVLVAPTGSVIGIPTFQWSAVSLATGYEVSVRDLTTGRPLAIQASAGTSWTPATPFVSGHRYRWMVRAVSASGTRGVWSSPFDFDVT
jgi:hypothetical protein